MTDRTTIKIEITAFDDRATTTYRMHATSKDNPAASVAALVSLLDDPRPSTYREQLAAVSGLDPCELDVSESEAPRSDAQPDLDTDRAAAHIVIEWAGVCTNVSALRAAIQREKAREHASPRKAVRSSVIAACEARLAELDGEAQT